MSHAWNRRCKVAMVGAVAALGAVMGSSLAAAHTATCTINNVGGRAVCHANVSDDNLWARPYDTAGFCPSVFWKVSTTMGFATDYAVNVCDMNPRGTTNFFCVGCRPTNISIDNNYPSGTVGTRYLAWHN